MQKITRSKNDYEDDGKVTGNVIFVPYHTFYALHADTLMSTWPQACAFLPYKPILKFSSPQVIFPKANRHDYEELSEEIKAGITAHFASSYGDVFKLALEHNGSLLTEVR